MNIFVAKPHQTQVITPNTVILKSENMWLTSLSSFHVSAVFSIVITEALKCT